MQPLSRPAAVLFALLIGVGACGAEEEVEQAEVPIEELEAPVGGAPSLESPGPAIETDSLAGVGAYLTDESGRALYLLEGEPRGESTCYESCAEEWPPYLAEMGAPSAANPAVQPALIATLQRRDGTTQVTYGGHALYYYHDDQGPGDTSGHDLTDQWGEWYLVSPAGGPLE